MKFDRDKDRLVICGAMRTPVGQVSKSLSKIHSFDLGAKVAETVIKNTGIDKKQIDGVVVGEIGQSSKAPNSARVISVKTEIPLEANAITVQNNCVSGFEAINEAARRILLGENNVVLVIGEESMSNSPIYLDNIKRNSKTANVDKIKKNWNLIPELEDVEIVDGIAEGLNDPIRDAMMFTTAEVVAQKLGIEKETLDKYAHNSYKKTLESLEAGKYDKFLIPVEHEKGTLEKDEYIMSKTTMVEKPERFAKATPIYDMMPGGMKGLYEKFGQFIGKEYKEGETKGAVSLFNSCPQSDGAAGLILTTESKAKELGLKPQAIIKGWGYKGVDPVIMGLGIAHAMKQALENTGLKWEDMSSYDIHEAFAATALGSMMVVRDEFGYDLVERNEKGDVNRSGGTLAIGHPLGATGLRVAINQIIELENDSDAKYSMGAICAGGGVGGAMILEKP